MDEQRLPELIRALYRIVGELEAMFPGRHFTPDGHMVGSLGECLAAYHYGLTLLRASTRGCDAEHAGGRVEIKATQGRAVALRCESQHLLVLKLDREGGFVEEYNGPGAMVWERVREKRLPSNGQHQVSLVSLRSLMKDVPQSARLPRIR